MNFSFFFNSLLLLLLILMGCSSRISAQQFFPSSFCSTPNSTISSSEFEGIREVTSALINNSSSSLFHNTSSSTTTNTTTIYGMFQCIGGIPFQNCSTCVSQGLSLIPMACQNSTRVHIKLNECHIGYDNRFGIFDGTAPDMSFSFSIRRSIYDELPNNTYQSDVLEALLAIQSLAPFQPNYYAEVTKGFVYAQGQCDSYISESQCSDCLGNTKEYVNNYKNESIGAGVFMGSCFYCYDDYLFYNIQAPSPSPTIEALLPSSAPIVKEKGSIIGAIVGGIIGSFLFAGLIA